MGRALAVVPRLSAVLLVVTMLPGCPLSLPDDYEIAPQADEGGGAGVGGSAASDGGGGSGGSGVGGTGAVDAGAVDTGGTDAEPIPECAPSNCANTCCGAACIDTTADDQHCGACDTPCPALRSCVFGKCSSGWLTVAAAPASFAARDQTAHTWTGSRVFIWGGVNERGAALDSGALYDPLMDQWKPVAKDANTPSPRSLATAVWTGSVVVVWGGGDDAGSADYRSGARYDPAADAWLPMADGPNERRAPVGIWTGSKVLFWGGFNQAGAPVAGAVLYDPVDNSWTTASTNDDPGPVLHAAWAWSGTYLYLYGGQPGGIGRFDKAYRLDPAANAWAQLQNGPSNRYGSFGAWDGTAFVATSGRDGATPKDDGEYFNETAWSSVNKNGIPTNRFAPHRQSGWSARVSDGVSLFIGGMAVTTASFVTNGGIYDRALNQWRLVPAWPSGQDHEWGVGVWTGSEFVVWGGRNAGSASAVGERYLP